jgi:hypothetical protein
MSYPCICLIACHIYGTMYRVASICFCISQHCTSHRTMYMTCYKTYTWIRHNSVKGEYDTWFCSISLLTSQFTFDIVAILYRRDLTVRHAQHCDGQWLILDRYCLPSFQLLCDRCELSYSDMRVAGCALCVISLWRSIVFVMEHLISEGRVSLSVWRCHMTFRQKDTHL